MVSWSDRTRLTMEYGAGLLVLGGLFNAACYVFLSMAYYYSAVLLSLILKAGRNVSSSRTTTTKRFRR